jgi:bacteriocin-like protein
MKRKEVLMTDKTSKAAGRTLSPDALVEKAIKQGSVELTEKDLDNVSGGLKLDGIKGESQDDKYKGGIDIAS